MAVSLRRITTSKKYVPEIDGLRFLAIWIVLTAHVWGNWLTYSPIDYPIETSQLDKLVRAFTMQGILGVKLFFMISGFILALPWAKSHLANGDQVALGSYYWRRITRLEPPYFIVMIGYFFLLCIAGKLSFESGWPNLVASLFYCHNLVYGGPSEIYLAAWSLEVEVQFYLLAPLIAQMFRFSPLVRRTVFALGIVFFSAFRDLVPGLPESILYQAQFFLAGFLLADFYISKPSDFDSRQRSGDLIALTGFLITLLLFPKDSHSLIPQLGYVLGMTMIFVAAFRGKHFRSLMRLGPITIIGGMCYTIYLLHGRIITIPMAMGLGELPLSGTYWLDHMILCIAFIPPILLLSALFFVVVERPCMDRLWPEKLWRLFVTPKVPQQ